MDNIEFIKESLENDLAYWEKKKKKMETMIFIEVQ